MELNVRCIQLLIITIGFLQWVIMLILFTDLLVYPTKKFTNTRLTSMKKINYLISYKGVNPFVVIKHNDLIPKISTKTY